jgi:transcriptional regulator with XRE-family HTH domain
MCIPAVETRTEHPDRLNGEAGAADMESGESQYFKARREASVHNERVSSRERAAELLGISPSTLANYELGITKTVPPDAVVMMADLYKAPELKCYYCANECPVGRGMPIATEISRIELITVKVIKALSTSSIEEAKTKLIELSTERKSAMDSISTVAWLLSYFDGLTEVLAELRLACQKLLAAGGVDGK